MEAALWEAAIATTRRNCATLHPYSNTAAATSKALPLRQNLSSKLNLSLDPLTEGGRGYPLLFQTGESWHDQSLHDRQHPDDLFDELSLSYSRKFTDDLSSYLYFGYPGEPALGPPTFMHRLSAMAHEWDERRQGKRDEKMNECL